MNKCPYCGESYYQEHYTTATAMYSPTIIKDGKVISEDPNYYTTTCSCMNCHHTFYIQEHRGIIEVKK